MKGDTLTRKLLSVPLMLGFFLPAVSRVLWACVCVYLLMRYFLWIPVRRRFAALFTYPPFCVARFKPLRAPAPLFTTRPSSTRG